MEYIPNEIISVLPESWRDILCGVVFKCYEIRVRVGQPVLLKGASAYKKLKNLIVTKEQLTKIIEKLCNSSYYAFQNELKQGYFTIKGGHRVGLSGQVAFENNSINRIKNFSSLNIRIAREVIGSAEQLLPLCIDIENNKPFSTLIIAPPGGGKTTLLRDLTRICSNGIEEYQLWGQQTSIIDERSEIASSYLGKPQLDIGRNTDVLDSCPKTIGSMMMLRSMGPQILVVDELGSTEDSLIIEECLNSGVTLFATAHSNSYDDLIKRPSMKNIMSKHLFKRIVLVKNQGLIKGIYDEKGTPLGGD